MITESKICLNDWIGMLDENDRDDALVLLDWIARQPDPKRLLDILFYGTDEEYNIAFADRSNVCMQNVVYS
ncbi:hypothetical protein [Anaerolentibacter hominis]|uniref:hypothetical protein n=1 Tax=Anaerolentibacter hominis TaxID=3079009 RepID=UPI0031B8376B